MVRAYLFSAASERVVARLKKDLFSHLIAQASILNVLFPIKKFVVLVLSMSNLIEALCIQIVR